MVVVHQALLLNVFKSEELASRSRRVSARSIPSRWFIEYV